MSTIRGTTTQLSNDIHGKRRRRLISMMKCKNEAGLYLLTESKFVLSNRNTRATLKLFLAHLSR